jgi:hypothetical protein
MGERARLDLNCRPYGRVTAHSEGPGRGAAFTLWLPLAAEGPAAA